MASSSRRPLLIVLGVALALRVGLVAATPHYVPSGDPSAYDHTAAALSVFGVYPRSELADPASPSAFRPPGYPVLLAGVYEVAGPQSWKAARLVGALLGVLSVLLLYLLVARAHSRRLGLWAAGIAAVTPMLIALNGTLLSESLFIPLVLGMLLCVVLAREHGGYRWAVAAGVLLGAAVLTRTNGLSLCLVLLLGLGWRRGAAAVACVAVALVPWTLRNASAFGEFLPLGTQSGFTMAAQWNASAAAPGPFHAIPQLPQTVPEYAPLMRKPGLDEAELDHALRERATTFARHHPGHVADALALNAIRTVGVGPGHAFLFDLSARELSLPRRLWPLLRISDYALFALAFAGAALGLRRERWRERGWLWLTGLLVIGGGLLWIGNPRHAAPLFPFLAVAAAYALTRLSDAAARDGAGAGGTTPG